MPVAAYAWVVIAQAGLLGLHLRLAYTSHPEIRSWVWIWSALALVGTIAAWSLAHWLVRQPQAAANTRELAWSDALRRRDLDEILLIGPALTAGVWVAVTDASPRPLIVTIATWAYILVLFAAIPLARNLQHRHALRESSIAGR